MLAICKMNGPCAALACAAVALVGCAAQPPGESPGRPAYETLAGDSGRGGGGVGGEAQRENARAVELMEAGDVRQAAAVLKGILSDDAAHGPAHNNLGKVYYHQGDLYRAALEFQYAAKLMPNAPEPANNLGLMLEAAGRLDEAAGAYARAVALEPENPQFVGNLARARVRLGERGEEVRGLLETVAQRDARPEWSAWARRTLSRLESQAPLPAAAAPPSGGGQAQRPPAPEAAGRAGGVPKAGGRP